MGSTRGLADDGKRLDFLSPRGPLHTECQRQLLHPKSLNDLYIISKGGGLEGGRLVLDWKGLEGWRMFVLGSGPPKQCSHVGKTHFFKKIQVFRVSRTMFYLHGSSVSSQKQHKKSRPAETSRDQQSPAQNQHKTSIKHILRFWF